MTFLENAMKAAMKKFLDEIEPEIHAFHEQLNALRLEFLDVARELSEFIELFKRHLVASRLLEDELRARLIQLEEQLPKNEPNGDESFHEEQ